MSHFRILSLDGGGSWALIEVRALMELFGDTARGHDVLRRFHLVVGNSGGSIVAAGLAADLSLRELYGFFLSESWRRRIFVRNWASRIPGLGGMLARYLTREKQRGFEQSFAQSRIPGFTRLTMEQWKALPGHEDLADLVIIAFDYDTQRARFFRTNPRSRASSFNQGSTPTFPQAIHASSNAPILFFDEPAAVSGRLYWDGAMGGYNNPALAGVVEALSFAVDGRPRVLPETIRVLSLGTGMVQLLGPDVAGSVADAALLARTHETGTSALLRDIRKVSTCILDDPPDAASFISHVVLGHRLPSAEGMVVADGPLVRMSPVLRPVWRNGLWSYPEWLEPPQFRRLTELELDALEQDDIQLIDRFCTAWLEGKAENQALRANGARFQTEVGHSTFPEARAQLRKWLPTEAPRRG